MKYQAVLFDLDGVLCQTEELHYQAWKELAGQLGIPYDSETNERMKGLSRKDSLQLLLGRWEGDFSPDEKARMADGKNRRYLELLEERGASLLDPDAIRVLEAVRAKGLKTAIGSSSKNARRILDLLGLPSYFDGIVDGTDIVRGKPDPEVFLLAASRVDADPGVCLVVEDALSGIQSAKAAGMDAVFLTKAEGDDGETFRIRTLPELLNLPGLRE